MIKPRLAVTLQGRPIDPDTLRAVAREIEELAALVESGKLTVTSESGILVQPQCECGELHCTRPGAIRALLYYNDKETCH